MTRTRKLVALVLLVVVVSVSGVTIALATDNTQTYAYLPDHSVYFYDVTKGYAWAHREVDALALNGVIKGGGDHLFYPDNPITRADFIVMLDRAYNMSAALDTGMVADKGNFSDVPAGTYYTKSIRAAKALGVANGSEDNKFQPMSNMTRQDAMVFLKRTIDRTQIKLQSGSMSGFSDGGQVSAYAKEAVSSLVSARVIGGSNGKLTPKSLVTRAEMAVMLYRATHLTEQDSGTFYEKRGDVINLCVGAQVYADVVIENYDPSKYYGELMRYTKLRQAGGTTYVTLEENQPIDRTGTYSSGLLRLNDPDAGIDGAMVDYLVASNCVAIDVAPYHQMDSLASTGVRYRYCYPSVVDGEVTAIYYIPA
ncbi:S-layer homology domain-containing protein [Agathobaculum sp.]|uniref:S-layer homology domain-containing protein n=1 Tax=Agathobaculum sp. TaxID=2048138 RepID=UPI002A8367E7|nr:S-layer homology domain-containing protein [Agathobaculum sp.]MDY3617424.1 S-layer homology domain-containing protein [Agathobaculum sp.]